MEEDHFCFDILQDESYTLGDHVVGENETLFSISAHRETRPDLYKKQHVWHFAVNPEEKEANITLANHAERRNLLP